MVNLDPANESAPYKASICVRDLVSSEQVGNELRLGPNGSLLFAMEKLESEFDWLKTELCRFNKTYFIFDLPGQIELYTHNDCIRRLVQKLTALDYRLTVVNLVDSHYCTDPAKFIAVLVTSLTILIKLELPAVNVLSKVDLIEQFGELPFNLDYFTECTDLQPLLSMLDEDPFAKKFSSLNRALCELAEDFPWVGFHTLDVQDRESLMRIVQAVDKANGYSFANFEMGNATYQAIVGAPEFDKRWVADVQERYTRRK